MNIRPSSLLAPSHPLPRRIIKKLRGLLLSPFRRFLVSEPAIIYRAEPWDAATVAAALRIAPQCEYLSLDPASRQQWEREQNNVCWQENAVLAQVLSSLPPQANVLEIGPGLGRSAVFLSKTLLPKATFHLFDATQNTTDYDLLGHRRYSFCGDLDVLQRTLEANGVTHCQIWDAAKTDGHLPEAMGVFDFIYSFYSVGYHWDLEHWMDELWRHSKPGTVFCFTVPNHYRLAPGLAAYHPRIYESGSPLDPLETTFLLVFTRTA